MKTNVTQLEQNKQNETDNKIIYWHSTAAKWCQPVMGCWRNCAGTRGLNGGSNVGGGGGVVVVELSRTIAGVKALSSLSRSLWNGATKW